MHQTYNGINLQYAVPQFLPFGEVRWGYFNAKEFDEENGMYYYSARYYAPPTFISRDPLFEIDPTFSPYTYCGNNPINFIDPTGEIKHPTPNGEEVNCGDGYQQTPDRKYLYGNGLKTKVWDPNADPDYTNGKGAYVDYTGPEIDFNAYENNPSISTNNKTGYYWNAKDLRIWNLLKDSKSPIGRYLRYTVENGHFEILSAENYWNKYGYTLGHLLICRDFIVLISIISPGPNNIPRLKGGVLKSAKNSQVPTFNEFRNIHKGEFPGTGRGVGTKKAWKAYKKRYGKKARLF